MNIYVGNLAFAAEEDELTDLFEQYGEVASVKIIIDRESGRSRGFGFVEMDDDDEAQSAIDALHQSEFLGRTLIVNEAKERKKTNNNYRNNNRGGGNNYRNSY